MRREIALRLIYSLVAFTGAAALHNIDRGLTVLAQSQAQQQYEHRDWDRHDEKEKQIDEHFIASDKKLGDVAEKVSLICGVGATIVTGLGVLNILGLIRPQHGSSEPSGKTHFITPE